MKEGYRSNINGWNFIQLAGLPGECGYWHGRLLAREIAAAILEAKKLILLQTGLEWDFFVRDSDSILQLWKNVLLEEPYVQFFEEA